MPLPEKEQKSFFKNLKKEKDNIRKEFKEYKKEQKRFTKGKKKNKLLQGEDYKNKSEKVLSGFFGF